jgi:hypothetical protein
MSSYNWESEFTIKSFNDLSEKITSRFMHIAVNDKSKLNIIQAMIAQEKPAKDSDFCDGELLILAIYYIIYVDGDLEKAKKMLKNKHFYNVFLDEKQGFDILLKLLTEKNDQQLMAVICYSASTMAYNSRGLLHFKDFLSLGFKPEYEFYEEFMYLLQTFDEPDEILYFLVKIIDKYCYLGENKQKIVEKFLDFALENTLLTDIICGGISPSLQLTEETIEYIQVKLNKKKKNLD